MGGQTNPPATQNITTTTELPAWYKDYLTNVMGKAQNVAATPYQPYHGQEVAGLTPDQIASGQAVNSLTNNYGTGFGNSAGMIEGANAANTNQAVAGALSAAGSAGHANYNDASGVFNQVSGANIGSQYAPYQQQATGFTYQAGQQADPLIQNSTSPTGLMAASPFLAQAGQPVNQSIGSYMSPYTQSVVNAIGDQSARNLQENLMPALSNDFVRAGQYGSTRQQQLAQNLVRDTNKDTLNQQAQALEAGYNNAGTLAEQDAARQAQLAGTAGGLGSQQQSQMLQAGSALGNLGLGQGNQLNQLGLGGANTAAQNYGLQLQAGQGLSGIGTAQANQAMNLANLESSNYANDATRQLQSGIAAGNLSNQWVNSGIGLASSQNAIGTQQQQTQQTSLNSAYQDFLNQRNYPQQQVDFLSSIVHGLPVNTSSYQSQTGPANVGQLQPSAAGQAAGTALGVAGLSKLFAKGGAVRRTPAKRRSAPAGLGSFQRAA